MLPRHAHSLFISIVAILSITAACVPPPSTPTLVEQPKIEITKIIEKQPVSSPLTQIKRYDQCDSDSPLQTQIQFSESNTDTNQKELMLGAKITGGADISGVAKLELEGAIQQRYASVNTSEKGYQEILKIEIPPRTHQEYTLIWKETRQDGTIEYTENGEMKHADYSYRIGLQLDSSTVKKIACPTPEIPVTSTPVVPQASDTPQPRTMADFCLSSQTWKIDSTDPTIKDSNSVTDNNGCYVSDTLGLYVDKNGTLHISIDRERNPIASGIFTPIDGDSVIEFKVYVRSMYIVYDGNPTYLTFAAAPAGSPMDARNTARFKLQVEKKEANPYIYFILADAGESNGVKAKNRHYEYQHTYDIRMELVGSKMTVYINGIPEEEIDLPAGTKVFYIGYNLPLLAGIDAEIKNIRIDGIPK